MPFKDRTVEKTIQRGEKTRKDEKGGEKHGMMIQGGVIYLQCITEESGVRSFHSVLIYM